MTEPALRGADHLAQALVAGGVTRVFALSGNQIMAVFDACLGAGLPILHTRHEAAAGYMAEAYAQITGEVGVALVTAGAGLGNAIAPLLTARASQTPLLLLSGDSPVARDGDGAFQEMAQTALTAGITKRSLRVTDPARMAATVDEALRIAASGIPGPVHLCLPDDVLKARAVPEPVPDPEPEASADPPPDLAALRQALGAASRPLLLLGPMLSDTRMPGLSAALAAATGAPALCLESPRGLDDPALGNWRIAARDSDCVLLLGKPVDFTLGFGSGSVFPQARFHLVHPDGTEIDRARRHLGSRLKTGLQADPRAAARVLTGLGPAGERMAWRSCVAEAVSWRQPVSQTGALTPDRLCRAVQHAMLKTPDPILVCDGGEFGQWAQAGLTAPRRVINGISGAIGGGLCYAIAARAARPGARVFALMGDGTVGFHLAEFETAVRADLPFVAIIGNDCRWNAEVEIQRAEFGPDRAVGCDLGPARYDLAVAALGGFGAHVTEPDMLDEALDAALQSGRPACVNVMIEGRPAPRPPRG